MVLYYFWDFKGPFTKDELIALIKSKKIKDNLSFWCTGLDDWKKLTIEEIEEIDSKELETSEFQDINNLEPKNIEFKQMDKDTGKVFLKISGILFVLIGLLNVFINGIALIYNP